MTEYTVAYLPACLLLRTVCSIAVILLRNLHCIAQSKRYKDGFVSVHGLVYVEFFHGLDVPLLRGEI